MKELLNKELKLVLHPTNILFIPLAFMLFIPNYPYLVIMFYTCLGVFFMCQFGRENNDVFFTMMLPVEKHKTVLARIISVSLLELLEIAVCVPIAFLRAKIMTPVNAADLDVNITLFAFFFMIFGVFNIIFSRHIIKMSSASACLLRSAVSPCSSLSALRSCSATHCRSLKTSLIRPTRSSRRQSSSPSRSAL